MGWGLFIAVSTCLHGATPAEVTAWKQAANTGDATAQWQLSQAYENRDGVEYDSSRALMWRHSAAEGGVAAAQYALAEDYFRGELGLARDVRTAVKWLRLAALQGHAEASYRLGEIYFNGFGGVEKNYALVAAAMKKPAAANYLDAKVYLGYLMFTGEGMAKNEKDGAAMLREAAAQGHDRASVLMWEAHEAGKLQPQDDAELQRWMEAASKAGDLLARERLGLGLFLGQGMPKDRDRARPLLKESAARGSVPAATALAQEIGEQLSGDRTLTQSQRQGLIEEYNRMAHLVAVNGGVSGMETYIRAITHLRPMDKLVVVNADKRISMGEDLIEALAWGRIYRAENGSDPAIFKWQDAGELWLIKYPPAALRVRERTKELLKLSAAARNR